MERKKKEYENYNYCDKGTLQSGQCVQLVVPYRKYEKENKQGKNIYMRFMDRVYEKNSSTFVMPESTIT